MTGLVQKSVGKPGVVTLCKATCDWLIIKMNKNSSFKFRIWDLMLDRIEKRFHIGRHLVPKDSLFSSDRERLG